MNGARYRAYRQLATRYHGRYESRGLSESPTVSFIHNGATSGSAWRRRSPGSPDRFREPAWSRGSASGIPFRMELAPVVRPAPPQPPKGTQAREAGDPEFDRGFVVQANDLEMARDFLSPAIRGTISNLHRAVHPGGMLVSINPERMLVQIDRNLGYEHGITGLGGPRVRHAARRTRRAEWRAGCAKASPSSTIRSRGKKTTARPFARSVAKPIADSDVSRLLCVQHAAPP